MVISSNGLKLLSFGFVIIFSFSCTDNKSEDSIKEELVVKSADSSVVDSTALSEKILGDLMIEFPEELKEMPLEKIKLKYPGPNRPEFVFGTEDMGVNLCYSVMDKPLKLSELNEYLHYSKAGIANQVGIDNVTQAYIDTINEIPFSIIEFYSPTPNEGKVYNIMCTTSLNNHMTIVSFNCLESRLPEWEEDISIILSSIKKAD